MQSKELIDKVVAFREERNWKQFHSIKDLCLGIGIEVSELQELFLWKTPEQVAQIDQEKVADELADVFIFLAYLCHDLNVDLDQAVQHKIEKNAKKYPVEKSRDSNLKYDQL